MVLKLASPAFTGVPTFESDVISDGTQTLLDCRRRWREFESDVISDGTQTKGVQGEFYPWFESDVISDGTQTCAYG